MKYLVIISTLFVIGSLIGWIIELFFRRFVSQKKWMNPGFLTGPYLPIYGFGVLVLYAVSNIPFGITNQIADIIVRILIIGVGMTVVEFIAGLIFIKGLKVKLWDYSSKLLNFQGRIALYPSVRFGILGIMVLYLGVPFIDKIKNSKSKPTNIITYIVIALFIIDVIIHIFTGSTYNGPV